MGKRKERRIAAKTASNRRVKLDLIAEPPGDFGDLSAKEVGGDGNAKNHAGSPNSPSSSGQRPENPLLLLGQYSDEEPEEESSEGISHNTGEKSPIELDDQVNVENCEGSAADKEEHLIDKKVEPENMVHSPSLDGLQKVQENGAREDNAAESRDLHRDIDAVEQTSVAAACDVRMTEDLEGWKMVLHEESNSYYYWNILTGETSWEVPVIPGQETESAFDPKTAAGVERGRVTTVDTHITSEMSDVAMDASVATQPNNESTNALVSDVAEVDGSRPELHEQNEQYTDSTVHDDDKGSDVNVIEGRKTSNTVGVSYGSLSEEFAYTTHSNGVLMSNGEAHYADSGIADTRDHVYQETASDPSSDSSGLLQLGEYLLERLKPLKGLEGCNDQISKLMFELEMRLEDIRSLVPYGSSLLPFWLHSENQLKKLESAINIEVLKCSEFANGGGLKAPNSAQQHPCQTSADEKNATSTSFYVDASDRAITSEEIKRDSSSSPAVSPENVASMGPPYSDSTAPGEAVEDHGKAISADLIPQTGLHSEADVDMDVEMEVEDPVPCSDTLVGDESGVHNVAQQDQSVPPNPHPQNESLGFDVPPPPDDEWIPPPPPDNEPLPPQPPDEPPEGSFPPLPSETQTAQAYSYGVQYHSAYPGSGFEYYGQTNTEAPINSYYVDANGCQVAAPLPSVYYTAVPNPYPDATSVVNSAEPVHYYTLQEGAIKNASVVSNAETSGLHNVSIHGSTSDQTGSTEALKEVGFTPLSSSSSQLDVSATDREVGMAFTEVPSISASTTAPANSTVTRHASTVSAHAVPATVALTEPIPNVQPKVSRTKKRTVATVSTLRSSKKVSGLVDKWMAVKEKLHEDEEDEPENPYEILEKKRQREIEQWLAQQIATGEAKNNANFQPLGGDWRERVKRKRAKRSREAEQNISEVPNDGKEQPDLNELTKQLPSGWQAYWDEASKQVYYGNSATSETTWIKPTI